MAPWLMHCSWNIHSRVNRSVHRGPLHWSPDLCTRGGILLVLEYLVLIHEELSKSHKDLPWQLLYPQPFLCLDWQPCLPKEHRIWHYTSCCKLRIRSSLLGILCELHPSWVRPQLRASDQVDSLRHLLCRWPFFEEESCWLHWISWLTLGQLNQLIFQHHCHLFLRAWRLSGTCFQICQ